MLLGFGEGADGVAKRSNYRDREHQWRLSNRLAAVNHIVLACVFEQGDAQVFGDIADRRDLVGRRRMSQQLTAVVPDQFFCGQPAQALDEAPFHLALVDRRHQGIPHVVQDVYSEHPALSGETTYLDLADRGAICEVVEGLTPSSVAVIFDSGRAVVARSREGALLQPGLLSDGGEVQAMTIFKFDAPTSKSKLQAARLVEFKHGRRNSSQPFSELSTSIPNSLAIEVGTTRCRGR